MAEKQKSLVSSESLRIIAAAAQVGEVSPDVLSFLSASAEYHLLDVVKDASLFCSRGKRSRLSVDDVNYSLELRGIESSVVIGGATSDGKIGPDKGKKPAVGTDVKVDLRKVANAPLPVCPREPYFGFHWLAVDGQQPLVPENPIPSSSAKGAGKTKVGSKRSRSPSKDSEEVEGTPNLEPQLSEELQTYLRRCCEAVLSRDEEKRTRALTSLRNDQGLLQLLTHLCSFIREKLFEYLLKKKDPDQLAALLQMMECLILNPNFAFIEIYLDKLMPPLLSCLLHEKFERQGEKDESADVKPKASKGRVHWTHWNVRDYAAELIGAIHHMYGRTYPALQARTISMCCKQMEKPKTPMTTLYGAIRGLAALGSTTMKQTLWPLIDKLVARISREYAASVGEQDADAMEKANLCTMALLQATGATTVFNTQGLFRAKKPTESGATAASAKSAGAGGQSVAAASSVKVAAESKGEEAGRAAGAAGSDKSRGTEKSAAAALRRRSRLQKRLDRSLYPPRGSKTSSRPSGSARKERSAGAAAVEDASALSPLLAFGGAGVPQDGHALQELLISWFVTGLKKDDTPETRWLRNRLGVFI